MRYKTCYTCGKIIKDNETCSCQIKRRQENRREYMREYEEKNAKFTKPIKTEEYKRFRKSIINRDGGYCQRCKNMLGILTTENLEVHHIKPRSKYPELIYEPSNVITVCKHCNIALGTSGELDFTPDDRVNEEREYKIF